VRLVRHAEAGAGTVQKMLKSKEERECPDEGTRKSSAALAAIQWLPVLLPILAGIVIFACLAAVVARLVSPSEPTPQLAAALWVDPAALNPEPLERNLYLAAMLFFPAFFLAWFCVGRRSGRFNWPLWAGYAACGAIALVVVAANSGDGFFYWTLNACANSRGYFLAVALLALAAALVGKHKWTARLRTGLGIAVPIVFCAGICAAGVFGRDDAYVWYPDGHFDVPFFSVVRSYLGDPLVSKCGNQYGLYPLFLLPLFRLVGLTVTSYSATMSLLVVVYLLCLWVVCRYAMGNRWLSLGIWASAVTFSLLAVKPLTHEIMARALGSFFWDPYFQFAPIRTLFPGFAMALTVLRLRSRHLAWVWIGHVVLAVGVLWNFETGAVAWLAWMLFLSYQEAMSAASSRQRVGMIGRRWLSGVGVLAAVLMGSSAAYRAQVHAWPQWNLLFDYQQIFYLSGFNMLPMPLLHPWNLAALAYLLGLAYSFSALFRSRKDASEPALVFFLSVLGIGVFSYYQGRSHPSVFPAVTAPAWILFGLFVDRHLHLFRNRVPAALLVALLGSWTLTGIAAGQYFWPEAKKRWKTVWQDVPAKSEDIAYLRAKTGEARPLVLSLTSSVYYLAAAKPPEFCPCMGELFLSRDYLRLMDALKHTAGPVFIDSAFIKTIQRAPWLRPLDEFLQTSFSGAEPSPSKQLFLLIRRPRSQ